LGNRRIAVVERVILPALDKVFRAKIAARVGAIFLVERVNYVTVGSGF
jgi:hypothetical protein